MKLPPASSQYSQPNEQQARNQLEQLALQTHQKGRHIDLGGNDFYIILTSPDGTRYALSVANGGTAVFTAL